MLVISFKKIATYAMETWDLVLPLTLATILFGVYIVYMQFHIFGRVAVAVWAYLPATPKTDK